MTERRPDRDAVGRLIELAGPRPRPNAEELDRLKTAGRDLWRASLESRRGKSPPRIDRPPRRTPARRWLALAAILVAAAGLVFLLRSTVRAPVLGEIVVDTGDTERVGAPVRTGNVLEVGAGDVVALSFGDAQVRLDADTTLRVEAADRLRLERGAVFVDADRRDGALAVVTELGRAVDVGTRFQVGYRAGEMSVRVRAGLVRLEASPGESADGDATEVVGAVEIGAGRGASLSAVGNLTTFVDDGWGEAWRWIETASPGFPLASASGAGLDAVLRWVATETGWRLRYADPDLASRAASIRVGGSLEGLSPRDALAAVTAAAELEWRVDDGVLWIEPPK